VTDESADEGLRERLTRQGEDALGKLAQDVLENPLFNRALGRALDAREKAAQAQEVAMGALNLPSAADIERLTRRVRSVSQRIEGIEDGLDRVEQRFEGLSAEVPDDARLERIEARLDALTTEVAAIRESLAPPAEPVPREQERLKVGDAAG
jgi:predicted  nucleic acid-binding Zn-ribbon protein